MLDIRESTIIPGVFVDQLGDTYYLDKHGNYIEYRPYVNKKGYKIINTKRTGKRVYAKAHRIVATAFFGECPDGSVCCHLNGNPGDNRVANLSWVTQKVNIGHKVEHGTASIGERHGRSKLTESAVSEIRKKLETPGVTHKDIAVSYGVARPTVSDIAHRRTWKHLT